MITSLEAVMRAADRITVDAIAQSPACLAPGDSVQLVYEGARREGFDWLLFRDRDGAIRRFIRPDLLSDVSTWEAVNERATGEGPYSRFVGVDDLVARDAPIFSILDRLDRRIEFPLLCLGRNGIDGVLTRYDLVHPAALSFGFSLALVVEGGVGRRVEEILVAKGVTEPARIVELARAARVNERTIKGWEKKCKASDQLPLVPSLSFGQKISMLRHLGVDAVAKDLGGEYADDNAGAELLDRHLQDVLSLRNDMAHDDVALLLDHRQTSRRLSLAHTLAHRLSGVP